jgi:uncharacterized membrane protein YccF (DUF307 family)
VSLFGNLIWIVFGGLLLFFEYLLAGLVLCLTIVGIPFGVQCMKLSLVALMPFGRKIVERKQPAGVFSIVMNVVWILVGGVWIAVTHLIFAVLFALTLIGIPFAGQHLKLAGLSLAPFGKTMQ